MPEYSDKTYTHGKSTTEIVQDNIGAGVSGVIHFGVLVRIDDGTKNRTDCGLRYKFVWPGKKGRLASGKARKNPKLNYNYKVPWVSRMRSRLGFTTRRKERKGFSHSTDT